jgi:hypothetical protein
MHQLFSLEWVTSLGWVETGTLDYRDICQHAPAVLVMLEWVTSFGWVATGTFAVKTEVITFRTYIDGAHENMNSQVILYNTNSCTG